jgi:hypothetical protein
VGDKAKAVAVAMLKKSGLDRVAANKRLQEIIEAVIAMI